MQRSLKYTSPLLFLVLSIAINQRLGKTKVTKFDRSETLYGKPRGHVFDNSPTDYLRNYIEFNAFFALF